MIKRIIFTITEALKHRSALPMLPSAKDITVINWEVLYQSGIRIVVLDFDGVLAADRQQQLHQGIDIILTDIVKIFGEHVYIFSNQPTLQRKAYFSKHFPQIQFLIAKKKPYPDGLLEVIIRENVQPETVVLVDDRVLTGGLAAVLAGVKCILIEEPYVSLKNNIIRELFFMSLRMIEKFLFR